MAVTELGAEQLWRHPTLSVGLSVRLFDVNGQHQTYPRVDVGETVNAIVRDLEGKVALVWNPRPCWAMDETPTIPGGMRKPGEGNDAAMARQLKEEIGSSETGLVQIGRYRPHPCSDETTNIYLLDRCRRPTEDEQRNLDTAETRRLVWLTPDEIDEMIDQAEIVCGQLLAALTLLRRYDARSARKEEGLF